MDNLTLIRILGQTPETKLKLLELAESPEQWTGPLWNKTPEQKQEMEEATTEAANYARGTRRLSQTMRRIVMHPSS